MNVQRVAAWLSVTLVTAAAITGFVLSGTPAEQRLKRLDERRVFDLRELAVALNSYWQGYGTIPEELHRLLDGRSMTRLPTDPGTALPYPYERLSASRYRLCATFDSASEPWESEDFWAHTAGEHCYDFHVSLDRSRPWLAPLPPPAL